MPLEVAAPSIWPLLQIRGLGIAFSQASLNALTPPRSYQLRLQVRRNGWVRRLRLLLFYPKPSQ